MSTVADPRKVRRSPVRTSGRGPLQRVNFHPHQAGASFHRPGGGDITVTDMFCGAGGSTTGALRIPGVTVVMAMNHWPLATATHNANHQDTDHDTADVSQASVSK